MVLYSLKFWKFWSEKLENGNVIISMVEGILNAIYDLTNGIKRYPGDCRDWFMVGYLTVSCRLFNSQASKLII